MCLGIFQALCLFRCIQKLASPIVRVRFPNQIPLALQACHTLCCRSFVNLQVLPHFRLCDSRIMSYQMNHIKLRGSDSLLFHCLHRKFTDFTGNLRHFSPGFVHPFPSFLP